MNFRRGLVRLWLVISGLWIIGILLCSIILVGAPGRSLYQDNTALVWATALVPPLVLRALIALTGWVIAGLFSVMILAVPIVWAQDKPSDERLAHAVDICENEFMVACTLGGDPRKDRCFTVPACYQVVHQFYGELLEKLNEAQDLDREFVEETAKGLK